MQKSQVYGLISFDKCIKHHTLYLFTICLSPKDGQCSTIIELFIRSQTSHKGNHSVLFWFLLPSFNIMSVRHM